MYEWLNRFFFLFNEEARIANINQLPGTDGFTSPPKDAVMSTSSFSRVELSILIGKKSLYLMGLEPATFRLQFHTLTSRPLVPSYGNGMEWKYRWWYVMYEWMDGWMDRWMDGWMDGCMNGRWMDEWMDEWIGRWIGGWMDEWKDEWIGR